MILDQNTIVLNPCNGFYDEFNLVSTAQADANDITTPVCILPGAIVGQKTVEPIFDVKKYPFFKQPGMTDAQAKAAFDAAHAAAVAAGGETLEAFYAKYPRLHVITAGYTGESAIKSDDLNAVEILILVENALLGKGICALYFPGERTPVYSPVSGDRYLARCVPGTYTEGDPLYLTDYSYQVDGKQIKGYYFCGKDYQAPAGSAKSTEIKAFAGEDFIAPETSNPDRKPYPYFRDVIDDSTTERPSTTNINGALTNLLRVRMA